MEGTNTTLFINKEDVTNDLWKDVTHDRVCVNYRAEKREPNRTRITAGGDRVDYSGDCGTPTVDLLAVKLLLNIVVSTQRDRYIKTDIKYFISTHP